ncbi:MAG: hypothetical protein KF767_03200 [Bdellovibrionaceae bacterium]|nr:hypothetical protein [Pseudobdellovibrionaceae bacterium]
MKILMSLLTLVLTAPAFAAVQGSIAPCYKDRYTAGRIDEIPKDERIGIRNPRGEEVGALVFEGKRGTKASSMYLCGNNSGYYYVDADIKDWVGPARQKIEVGSVYNDEYDASTVVQTLSNNRLSADIVMTIRIKFTGDAADADYTEAAGDIMMTLPLDR